MSRLTKKDGEIPQYYWIKQNDGPVAYSSLIGVYGGGRAIDKLGQLEDICEDILNWTDGRTENTDTIIITFKSSEKLLKLLDGLL